jgi:hypothetical protein
LITFEFALRARTDFCLVRCRANRRFFSGIFFLNIVAATPNGLEKCPQLVVHDRKLGEV